MNSEKLHNIASLIGPLTGVHVETLDLEEDFLDLAARFATLSGTVILLSGGDLDCARYHLMGVWPWLSLSGRRQIIRLTVDGHESVVKADPFDLLRATLNQLQLPLGKWHPPMAAGLMGYLAYDLKDELERLPRTSVDELNLPHLLFYAPSVLVVHDKQEKITRLLVPERSGASLSVDELVTQFHQQVSTTLPEQPTFRVASGQMASNFSQPEYRQAVQRVIDYIAAGDVYQVNLSQRFEASFSGDGFALFRHLYELNPAPFFAFIQAGDHQIVSTSPERFLKQTGQRVEARPIKGTRPRGRTADQDAALRKELVESTKDDAELSMIVDLLRNDIGKVCKAGSVRVAEHKRLEAYQNVYHLVSTVEGQLDQGKNSVDLIKATFPGGSITGCPKVRTMEIIDELETCRRHIYCGSIGYIGFDASMDLSIAIRTATIVNDTLRFSAGGGIVYDSDPQEEFEETLHKAHTLMTACRGNPQKDASEMVWINGGLKPARNASVHIADQGLLYGFGFFETIRVDQGKAPLLTDHLARFDATWRTLMPDDPPDLTWEHIISQVIGANGLQHSCAAVKIVATRGSRNEAPWDHTLLVTAQPYTHRLAALKVQGLRLGIYPHPRQSPLAGHKTLNYLYYLQAGHWARDNHFHEALILNPDGTVSETNTANLFLIKGRNVIRPASSAVLPGVMAQVVSRHLKLWGYDIVERPVLTEELHTTQQLLATNALMGAVPVITLDGKPRDQGDDLWQRLNDAILPGWQ